MTSAPEPPTATGPVTRAAGVNIRRLRRAQGVTLVQLGEKVAARGRPSTHSRLSNIERGLQNLVVDDLVAIAAALGVQPGDLLAEPADCTTCGGEPPAGFQCRTCGA